MGPWEYLEDFVGNSHAFAGLIGAFGFQVINWGNHIKNRGFKFRAREMFYSILYIITGSGLGHINGIDDGTAMVSASFGFSWPIVMKSMEAAKGIYNKAKNADNIGENT